MNENWFKTQIDHHEASSIAFRRQSRFFALLRTLCFALMIITLFVSIYLRLMDVLVLSLLVGLVLFALLVKRHNRILHQKKISDLLVNLNGRELKRLDLDLQDMDSGDPFINRLHPNNIDLDLFGAHSLFQLLDRTVTPGGRKQLADAINHPAPEDEIQRRQGAAKELAEKHAWVMDFLAAGKAHDALQSKVDPLINWINDPLKPVIHRWFKPVMFILPPIAFAMVVWYFTGGVPSYYLLPVFFINGYVLFNVQPLAKDTYLSTYESIKVLSAYQEMIKHVEVASFDHPYLVELQAPFKEQQAKASNAIAQLRKILHRIETRQNFFYWIFNMIFLLDLIWLMQAATWKRKHQQHVAQWFHSLSRLELLTSIGLTRFANPSWTDPEIDHSAYIFEAKALGHPLIHPSERQQNDFSLSDEGKVVVLTGSNMSGKSTFLRTVGINTVLAYMGAPVCAQGLRLGYLYVFTSMRTTDSLEEHVSSFYAELKRLKQLINHLDQPVPTLFLLDEILKGTNSEDRNKGATALIKQLHNLSAFGIVSTHDLALGRLADTHNFIENYSFNSTLRDGKLHFDYRLTKGICQSFNASELMAQMGIEMNRWQEE